MNRLTGMVLRILLRFFDPKSLLKQILKLHNISYELATSLSITVDPNGIHPKHRIMGYHNFFAENVEATDTIIDIGCGRGLVALDMAAKAKKVVGIDIVKGNIQEARKLKEARRVPNVEFICCDIQQYDFKEHFDMAILSNVLEHLSNRVDILCAVSKIARKILIRVPMENRDWITLLKKEMGVTYMLDPTHILEYTMDSFVAEVERASLVIEKYTIQFGEIWAVAKKV